MLLLALGTLAAGCASVDPYASQPIAAHLVRAGAVGDCARALQAFDRRIDVAGTRDAGAPRVPGFPYLRADRFLADLAAEALRPGITRFDSVSQPMAAIDRSARALEAANAGDAAEAGNVDACRERLRAADRGEFERLRAAAAVPDDYADALRVLGVYPLTRLAFAAGIRAWQARTREVFATPLERLPVAGKLHTYAPGGAMPPVAPLALDAPRLRPAEIARWLERHAPAWVVDTASDDDRPGALHWAAAAGGPRIEVDPAQPVVYARAAWTRFGGRVRLQLVYTLWFAARPAEGALDVLAGRLDGLLWRVTLDEYGEPLVYDSIHPCGCYHQFFPTARVAAKRQPDTLDEGLFAPQGAPALAPGERIALRVASSTHYLQRVLAVPAAPSPDAVRLALRDEQALLVLPWPGGRTRSAFGPDGFIAGSERAERFFFWPMGIESAGQMRQWGRHATAFVGRRHFDDARLLDRYFVVRAPGTPRPDD